MTQTTRWPPGPRYRTPLAFLADFRRDPLRLLGNAFREHGDTLRIRFAPGEWGPFSTYVFCRPDHVGHVLHDNYKNYWKGILGGRLRIVAGQGLLVSEGEQWRRQRRLAQPAFHRQRIAGFVRLMTETINAMLERWQPAAVSGEAIDLAAEMQPLTTTIVWQAMVGRDALVESRALARHGLAMNEFLMKRITQYVPTPLWLPTRENRAFRRALGFTEGLIYRTIAERRQASHPGDDLLGMFLASTDPEGGSAMTDRQVRDELMTVLGAGQDTTAVLLAWSWWLLARHPDVEARLRHEVESVLNGRVPTIADVPALSYVRMVLQEALRLYPPAWAIARQSIAEDEIGGYRIPARTVVTLCSYRTHRHPELWPDPERYDPERFTPRVIAARPRFAFFPFGGGPRVCIGLEFALLEATLTLVMVCQRYRFRLVPDRPVEPCVQLLLRPRNGVWMTLAEADGGVRPRKPGARADASSDALAVDGSA
jgi:cytochrome P450